MINGVIIYDNHACEIDVNEDNMATFVGGGTSDEMVISELLIEKPLNMEENIDKILKAIEAGEYGQAIGIMFTADSIFIIKDEETAMQVELTDPKQVIKDNIDIMLSLACDL